MKLLEKVNGVYAPLVNEYGSNYGTVLILFPEVVIDREEFEGNLKNNLVYLSQENIDGAYDMCYESHDVWSQWFVETADSARKAIERYYEV